MKTPVVTLVLLATTLTVEFAAAKPPTTIASALTPSAETSGSQAEEASQRFQRGVKLYRERSFDAALAEFNRAYELAPNYRVLFNIGQVHAERGDYVAAIKAFRQYQNEGGAAIDSTRAAEVQTEITRLEGRIAKITITSNVDGAELFVDGERIGTLPQTLVPVNAGSRRISVRKKGYDSEEVRMLLATGDEKTLDIKLQKGVPQASSTTPASSGFAPTTSAQSPDSVDSTSGLGTPFWVSLTATVVAGGATAVFAVLTNEANDNYDSALNHFPGSQSRIDEARRDLKRNALFTDVCGTVTLVGLASTVYFAMTSGSEKPKEAGIGRNQLRTGPVTDGSGRLVWQVSGRF